MCNVEAMSLRELEAQVTRGLATRRASLRQEFGASDIDFQRPSALECLVFEVH
jgi:hypothetical protein